MSKRPRTIAVLSVLALSVAAALTAGCDIALNTLEDGLSQPDRVTEVHIKGGSGNVTVVGDSTAGVEVRRTVRYATTKPGQTMTVSGSTLTVDTGCGNRCSASYEVHVGRGVKVSGGNDSGNVSVSGASDVDLKLDSGNIDVNGATGTVTVEADSGNIDLADIAGAVRATVSSGRIQGRDLRGDQIVLGADSGNITVTVPGTGDLTARADSGNIEVRLPNRCCRVHTSVDSGKVEVAVQLDPTSVHTVDLTADSGNIEVRSA